MSLEEQASGNPSHRVHPRLLALLPDDMLGGAKKCSNPSQPWKRHSTRASQWCILSRERSQRQGRTCNLPGQGSPYQSDPHSWVTCCTCSWLLLMKWSKWKLSRWSQYLRPHLPHTSTSRCLTSLLFCIKPSFVWFTSLLLLLVEVVIAPTISPTVRDGQ